MSSVPKHERYTAGDSPGGKSRGNRLARRARSFKEDFLGILSQMRSPGGSGAKPGSRAGSRAGSPSSPRPRGPPLERPPAADLEAHVRQTQLALKHFRDVVAKDKLEMLPGNGTIVLETVTAIHVLLKKYLVNEQSSTLVSATNQVYQSVAKLIRLCDDYLLLGEKALGRENVSEVLQLVEEAIQNLVELSKDKLAMREACLKLTDGGRESVPTKTRSAHPSMDSSQRSSLPDIPLTPRERQILQQTSACVLERHSHSSENILQDSPPPKPPHPDRSSGRVSIDGFPPPLPPKKRHKQLEEMCGVKSSLENLSLRSKSPGDSSLFSESAGSLDSVLNHSREDELRHLLDDSVNAAFVNSYWDSSSSTSTELKSTDHSIAVLENAVTRLDRLSGGVESGFSSFQSCSGSSNQRSSTSSQQLSTRSSQVSHVSQESHLTERKIFNNAANVTKYSNSVTDCINGGKIVTNGVSSVTKQTTHSSTSYTTSRGVVECSCCHGDWADALEGGDIISYCPTHRARLSPSSTRLDNPLEDGWSLLSSPSLEDDSPPALPEKARSKVCRRERHPSQYDNVPDSGGITTLTTSEHHAVTSHTKTVMTGDEVDSQHQSHEAKSSGAVAAVNSDLGLLVNSSMTDEVKSCMVHSKTIGGVTEATVLRSGFSSMQSSLAGSMDGRPPLPMKKKHIMAYMEMFGNASHGNASEFLRHSVHVYQQGPSEASSNCSTHLNTHSVRAAHQSLDPRTLRVGLPPALPPKRNRISSTRSSTSSPPLTPVHTIDFSKNQRFESRSPASDSPTPEITNESLSGEVCPSPSPVQVDLDGERNILEQLDATQHLVLKKPEDDGPEVRGGEPDGLLIHATKAHKNDFLYQEAFLTTYRTFMTPLELIQKLCWRYDRFSASQDGAKQRAAREGFSLLVRVVSDLTLSDVDDVVLQTLMEFVQALLCRGDLTMAKALRVVMLAKYEAKKLQLVANSMLPSHQVSMRQTTLLDLKSEQVAEQMTLLDAELFLKIEIPEVLIWAQEQNEERSPNLTRFTEHFNKMSYWARSRILEQNDARERERYVVKFIKIMKHLRKINNFNSYLALLSALDSAPIRRLEWQKHITEGLKEYCALIDSSSSFRAYRQALADTQPPCIPYIGLVLQDLTFVHIGNSNLLPDGGINFSKRWQQFNIVENMKKFKKGSYMYKKNERIISFFNGFDESLSEEAMWQISEKIKPRGGKKV